MAFAPWEKGHVMPASNRRDMRSYNTPGVVNGNLARDLRTRELERQLEHSGQLDFDRQYRQRQESNADKLSRQRQQRRAAVREGQSIPLAAVVCSAAVACLAVMVVNCHVQINQISGDIVSMKQQIALLEQEQVSLQTRYEQAFDLASVKDAAEAAGMHQPTDGQIYYLDLPGEDQAVVCQQSEKGALGRVFSMLAQRFCAVLEYFS